MFKYRLTIETDHFVVVSHFRNYFEMFSFLEKELNRYEEIGQPNKYFPTEKPIVKSVKHEKINMLPYEKMFVDWFMDKYNWGEVDNDDIINFVWTLGENTLYSSSVIVDNLAEKYEGTFLGNPLA